jgi:hypothetical protein
LRLSIPLYVLRGEGLKIKSKPHPEENPEDAPQPDDTERGKITSDWGALENAFKNLPADKQTESMIESFIQCDPSRIDRNLLKTGWIITDKDTLILNMAAIMSLPEFQLI